MTHADVVIVGAGIAGLSAAVASAEGGAATLVLERATADESGGNTRYTEAFMRMKSLTEVADDFRDHFMQNAGGAVDPALASETLKSEASRSSLARSVNMVDPEVLETFAASSGPTLKWLTQAGITFEALPSPFMSTSTSRLSPVGGGRELIDRLRERAERLGVGFRYETTATSLALDNDGKLCGVSVRGPGRTRETISTSAVVLASGGFEGSPEMLARYLGEKALQTRPVARGGHYNRGEGIRMALDIGAAPCGDYGLFHAEPIDPRSGIAEPALFIFPYGVLVNAEGHRFTDEAPGPVDANYEAVTRQIFAQTGGSAWIVLDARLEQLDNRYVSIRTDQAPLRANSLERLALQMDVPVDVLLATIESYNAACPSGDFVQNRPDGLATSGVVPGKSNWARPIDLAPFYAYPIMAANVFTFGGLRVDSQARVIDEDGRVIEGLYAAGETVGLYFGTYTGSTSVLKGAVFGKIAGEHATASRAAR